MGCTVRDIGGHGLEKVEARSWQALDAISDFDVICRQWRAHQYFVLEDNCAAVQ